MVSKVLAVPALLKRYVLCRYCLQRQSSGRTLGIRKTKRNDCYICNGLMGRLDNMLDLVLSALEEYEHKSFLIGAVLSSKMLEREDEIRAKFKIRGKESIKSYLTRELGKRLSRRTGARVDYARPDVTINVDPVRNEVVVRSKAVFLYGRYLKRTRGISQKEEPCSSCFGRGCPQCRNTGLAGFDSVEGVITEKLIDSFKCESTKLSWMGGEDKESLVLNGGRPFFVKVISPKLRFARPRSVTKGGVSAKFLKVIERLPDRPLRFRNKVKMLIECEHAVDNEGLKKLNALKDTPVRFSGKHGRETSRNIYRIRAKASGNMLRVTMVADGGITLKQFVSGDSMTPNISQLLGYKATCRSFDILNVEFMDR